MKPKLWSLSYATCGSFLTLGKKETTGKPRAFQGLLFHNETVSSIYHIFFKWFCQLLTKQARN